jgi:hypothetical protein
LAPAKTLTCGLRKTALLFLNPGQLRQWVPEPLQVRILEIDVGGTLFGVNHRNHPHSIGVVESRTWSPDFRGSSVFFGITDALLACQRYDEILPPGAIQSCHLNKKLSRLPNPAFRDRMATPVGATGSKVRVARQPPRSMNSSLRFARMVAWRVVLIGNGCRSRRRIPGLQQPAVNAMARD